jgi:hypothetical protein
MEKTSDRSGQHLGLRQDHRIREAKSSLVTLQSFGLRQTVELDPLANGRLRLRHPESKIKKNKTFFRLLLADEAA